MTTLLLHGHWCLWRLIDHINGLVQERHNSIANAMELHLSCTNPSMCNKSTSWELFFRLIYYCNWYFYFSVNGPVKCWLDPLYTPLPMVYQRGFGFVVCSFLSWKQHQTQLNNYLWQCESLWRPKTVIHQKHVVAAFVTRTAVDT